MRHYMHLAAANVVNNDLVSVVDDYSCHTAMLKQVVRDTIDSHSTGLFTARHAMEVLGIKIELSMFSICLRAKHETDFQAFRELV